MNEQELIGLIKEALEKAGIAGEITMDSELGDEGWDSLGQISVLAALDTHFEGKIATVAGIRDALSVRSILRLLRENNLL